MIQETSCIPRHIPIEIPFLVEGEDVNRRIACLFSMFHLGVRAPFTLFLINPLAKVFDDLLPNRDVFDRIHPCSMNFRGSSLTIFTFRTLL